MPYKPEILEALRDWHLPVVEVNEWRTRGSSSFNPGGAVNHHTAGARRYSIPSLNVLVNGHGKLPGPLCNVGQSRSTQYDASAEYDDVYLIAAGRANHAGAGGWRGLKGNSSVFGLEIEHVGDLSLEPWPERRQHTAYRIHAALAQVGGYSTDMIAQHREWTSRKVDFVGQDGPAFRSAIASLIHSQHPLPEDPMAYQLDIAAYVDACYEEARRTGDLPGRNYWAMVVAESDNPKAVLNSMRSQLGLKTIG